MNKRVKGLIASILAGALTVSILSPAASAKITINYSDSPVPVGSGLDTLKAVINDDTSNFKLDDTKVVKVVGKGKNTADIVYGPAYLSGSEVMDVLQELDDRTDEYDVQVDETNSVFLKKPKVATSYFYTEPEHTADISTFPYDLNEFAKEQGITNDLTEVAGFELWTCTPQGVIGNSSVIGRSSVITAQKMLDIYSLCDNIYSCVGMEITTKSKTFTFPVYDALFNKTDESISISADTAETAYNCNYYLTYGTKSFSVTSSAKLWDAINNINNDNSGFDPDKAYLVRTCTFNASDINGISHGDFTSCNLASDYNPSGESYFKNLKQYLWVLSDSSGNFITAAKGEELYGKDTANTALAEYFEKNPSTDKLNLRIFPNVLIYYNIFVPVEGNTISTRDSKTLDHLPMEISELASQITAPAKCRLDCDNWKLFGVSLSDSTIYEIEKTGSALDASSVFNGLKSNAASVVVYIPMICEISDAYLKVTAPVLGGTPENVFSFDSNYTVDTSWNTADSAFAADTAYTVTVKLTPKHNYEFTANTSVFINNTDASSVSLGSDGVLTATFEFPKTGKHSISSAALTVEAPALGGTPANASTADSTYTVAASWNPADTTFAADTAYTMTAVLTPAAGYEFMSGASVTVNGAAAKSVNLGNDGTLTVYFTFPKTGKKTASGGSVPRGTGRGNSTRDNTEVKPGTGNSQGWDEIVKEIQSAAVGSEIKITLNDGTVIPAEAIKALAERHIKLIADSGFGRIWTIDCAGLDSGKALDLSTSAVDVRIPEDSYKDIKCGGSVQLKLNAELPGAALSIALRKELAGKNAALYRLNESTGALKLLQTSAIDSDGRFIAEITASGKYFLAYDVEAAEIPAGTAGSGDINGDSVTNALDAALILKAVVGNVELPLSVGDVNGDGVVNALDAQKILADIVGTR